MWEVLLSMTRIVALLQLYVCFSVRSMQTQRHCEHLYFCGGLSASSCNYTSKPLVAGGVSDTVLSFFKVAFSFFFLCIPNNGEWNCAYHIGVGTNRWWTAVTFTEITKRYVVIIYIYNVCKVRYTEQQRCRDINL